MLGAHRAPLQFLHRFTNIVECHIICDVRRAEAWRDNKANVSAFELFVELDCIENFLARELWW